MSKIICYFSPSPAHATRRTAESITDASGSPLYEIHPSDPYSQADLNWMDANSRSTLENRHPEQTVELAGPLPDLAGIDTLFVGFPVWWYDAPRIIYSFLEAIQPGKIAIFPFCTSGGTDMKTCENKLKAARPDLNWKSGLRLTSATDKATIDRWLKEEI